jgi:hypothetical protein
MSSVANEHGLMLKTFLQSRTLVPMLQTKGTLRQQPFAKVFAKVWVWQ